jgi:hypothetical protein
VPDSGAPLGRGPTSAHPRHGSDAKAVFAELCEIVEDSIELLEREGRPLPEPISGREFVNALQRIA